VWHRKESRVTDGTWEFYPGILLKSLSSNYMAFPPAAGTLTLYLTVRAGCVK
jgi:hypothetical protein